MKKTKNPKGEKVKRTLTFKLTDEQKSKKGQEAAEMNSQLGVAMIAKKSDTDMHNAKIKTLSSKRDTLLTEIKTGTEKREVECVEVKNFDRKKVEWHFEGELKGERDLTEEDKQLNLSTNKAALRKFQQPGTVAVADPTDAKSKDIRAVHKLETGKNTAKSVLNN